MKSSTLRRITIPALAGAALATGLITAPAAQATEGHSCGRAYAQYESPGDYVYLKDTKKDGRNVQVNVVGPGSNDDTVVAVTKGYGHFSRINLNFKENETVDLYVYSYKPLSTTLYKCVFFTAST